MLLILRIPRMHQKKNNTCYQYGNLGHSQRILPGTKIRCWVQQIPRIVKCIRCVGITPPGEGTNAIQQRGETAVGCQVERNDRV